MEQAARPQQVVVVGAQKSVGVAAILALVFGPLGLLYSTVAGALTMFLVTLVVGLLTLGVGLLVTNPLCALWGALAAKAHNQKLNAFGSSGGAGRT